jgi:transcriptional regulator GlxA family with amidase domain
MLSSPGLRFYHPDKYSLAGQHSNHPYRDADQEDSATVRRHAAIMRRFYRVIEEYLDQPFNMPELAKAVGTSERTLTACCQEHLGMGPKRFLILRRMNMMRRDLRRAAPGETTVTEIATRYGFWQFGRLAVAYKAMFGESPSTTLARPV